MAKRQAKHTTPAENDPQEPVIDREAFDWGVRLTATPFRGTDKHALVIRAEVRNYRAGRGSEVYITFPAASLQTPLRLLDAQTWHAALGAIIDATRVAQSELRAAATGEKGG
jgi:hypothetical protein